MDLSQLGPTMGIVGGIAGSLVGIAGGLLGCYIPYRQAKTPRQRAFVLKASVFCWVLVLVFLAGIFFLPSPWKHLLWIPYIVILLGSIQWFNQQHRKVLEEESAAVTSAQQ